ncbi:hypothetical protein SAMN02949497_4792 [Methylomagnum ishizawai]|uniref:Uncharacterized protein n=1 Tax=Methylomagnum ishizawai TaxID=1760988 RepID=A0A1Y6DB37_9GAMM|nr:hypothetical protein [Methylomagnum ishizawai]SMF97823.1 hypothetical protein SAMN02949497_4792 [Methylomagnum ishizawai]
MDGCNSSTAIAGPKPGRPKSGNRCGHDPQRPRPFEPPKNHANRPLILRRIIERIRDYFRDPSTLPTLNAANRSARQQRTERREACCSLLGALMHYTDLVTLRVGIPQADGSMAGIPMETKRDAEGRALVIGLAERAGLTVRRAWRSIADLKRAGIITVHPRCAKLDDVTYKGFAAIRAINRQLFNALGLGQWLEHERRKAAERRRDKHDKDKKRKLIEMGRELMAATALMGGKRKPKAGASATDTGKTDRPKTENDNAAEAFFAYAHDFLGKKPQPEPAPQPERQATATNPTLELAKRLMQEQPGLSQMEAIEKALQWSGAKPDTS